MCYVDDVVIATPTLEDHINRLDEVFGCMKRADVKCKPSKCEILRGSFKYVGQAWRKAGPGSSGGCVDMEGFQNARTTQELPRVCQNYREFLKGYAKQVVPHAETDAQQRKEIRMERRSSSCLREHKAGIVRSASARHAYREGLVCS